MIVQLGGGRLTEDRLDQDSNEVFSIDSVVAHPDYRTRLDVDNDIAVARLAFLPQRRRRPIIDPDQIGPAVCLTANNQQVLDDKEAFVSGELQNTNLSKYSTSTYRPRK